MYAFDEQYRAGVQTDCVAAVFALSFGEIVGGQSHFLAVQYGVEIAVERLQVEGVKRLVVVLAVFVARGVHAVYEIIVKRDELRFEQIGYQLYGKSFGCSCLARRARPGNKDYSGAPLVIAPGDLVAYTGYGFFMQRLRHVYELAITTVGDGFVEVSDVFYAQDTVEFHVVGKSAEHFFLSDRGCGSVGARQIESEQQEAVVVRLQIKDADMSCRRSQRAVVAVAYAVEGIVGGIEISGRAQQACLVVESLPAEHCDDLVGRALAEREGQVGVDNGPHLGLDSLGCGRVGAYAVEHTVVTVAH